MKKNNNTMIKDRTTLKMLKSQREELLGTIEGTKAKIAGLQRELSGMYNAVGKLEAQIKDTEAEHKDAATCVSEHAMVQFLGRTGRLTLDSVESELLTPEVREAIRAIGGNGKVPVAGGLTLVLKNNVVVTVLPAGHKEKVTQCRKGKRT